MMTCKTSNLHTVKQTAFRLGLLLAILLGAGSEGFGQVSSLTSSNTGETGTSGTNRNITGNKLTVTENALIQAAVIENHLLNTGTMGVDGTSTVPVTIIEAINAATGGNDLIIEEDGKSIGSTSKMDLSVRESYLTGSNLSLATYP